jgi:hypothetical protein
MGKWMSLALNWRTNDADNLDIEDTSSTLSVPVWNGINYALYKLLYEQSAALLKEIDRQEWVHNKNNPIWVREAIHCVVVNEMVKRRKIPPTFKFTNFCRRCGYVALDVKSDVPLQNCPWCPYLGDVLERAGFKPSNHP